MEPVCAAASSVAHSTAHAADRESDRATERAQRAPNAARVRVRPQEPRLSRRAGRAKSTRTMMHAPFVDRLNCSRRRRRRLRRFNDRRQRELGHHRRVQRGHGARGRRRNAGAARAAVRGPADREPDGRGAQVKNGLGWVTARTVSEHSEPSRQASNNAQAARADASAAARSSLSRLISASTRALAGSCNGGSG